MERCWRHLQSRAINLDEVTGRLTVLFRYGCVRLSCNGPHEFTGRIRRMGGMRIDKQSRHPALQDLHDMEPDEVCRAGRAG